MILKQIYLIIYFVFIYLYYEFIKKINVEERVRITIVLSNCWKPVLFWYIVKSSSRPGISMEKISILRVMKKKKWTHPRFLHRGPKKAVEQDSDVHFDLT